MKKNNTILLTENLIRIPSYVGDTCNEIAIGEYLVEYCKRFSWMKAEKQYVTDKRFNVVLRDKYPTTLLVNGHLDTVQPRTGWMTNQFIPTIKNSRMYGLGATDMKGSLAAFLVALSKMTSTKGLMVLLYIDEEYDFAGMKKFIMQYKDTLSPKYILSLDGKELQIGNGCRGLIEFSGIVKGRSGHAAQPALGKNAIVKSVQAFQKLELILKKKYTNDQLGETVCNLAFLQGGLSLSSTKFIIGREGNNIPDIAEVVIDIRPASAKLSAKDSIRLYSSLLRQEGLTLEKFTIRHDYPAWLTPKNKLMGIAKSLKQLTPISYSDPRRYGYIDTAMLWNAFKKTPSFILGAGNKKTAHAANEFVDLPVLSKTTEAYTTLLNFFVKGGDK